MNYDTHIPCAQCGTSVDVWDAWAVLSPPYRWPARGRSYVCSQACLALWARETLVEATS